MTTIKLSKYGDDLQVSPSNVAPGSVAFCAYGEKIERVPAVATPAERDAFVAAGNAVLGRPAPVVTPLEERILRAWDKAKNESETHANRERAVYCDGQAQGLRAALAMVREAGPMVPRAALSDRNISELRAIVGTSPNDTFDQCVREIEALIVRLKTERDMGAQCEREEIENMIGDDTSPGILAVADRLIAMVRARSRKAAREQGPDGAACGGGRCHRGDRRARMRRRGRHPRHSAKGFV